MESGSNQILGDCSCLSTHCTYSRSSHLANDYGLSCDISNSVVSFFTFLHCSLSFLQLDVLLRDRRGVLFTVVCASHAFTP